MSLLLYTFLATAIIFSLAGTVLQLLDRLPPWLGVWGPFVILKTDKAKPWLDRNAKKYARFWKPYGIIGTATAFLVMLAGTLLIAATAVFTVLNPQPANPVTDPVNMLVLPGVNDFLPLSVAPEIIAGLFLGLVVHEGGHGIYCRVGSIDVESVGTLSAFIIPIGAFVEPDEDSQETATRRAKLNMFAAGVMNNFTISAILLVVLLGPMLWSMSVAPGAAVAGTIDGTPANATDLERGDRITQINDSPIQNNSEYETYLETHDTGTLNVSLASGKTTTLTRTPTVLQAAENAPFKPGTKITHVNGEQVNTTRQFTATLNNTSTTVMLSNGTTTEFTPGALVKAQPNSAAANAGIPTNTTVVITHIDDTRITSTDALTAALSNHSTGEEITVTTAENDTNATTITRTVTLGERSGDAYLGVSVAPGTTGMVFTDTGAQLYPAEQYLNLLQHGPTSGNIIGTSALGHLLLLLQFPAVAANGLLPFNFAGFTDGVQNFYTLSGPLSILGGAFFTIANIFFWTAWVNINLGIFNCFPTFLLDGGHMVREAVYEGYERLLNISDAEGVRVAELSITAIKFGVLAVLFVIIFGPRYFL